MQAKILDRFIFEDLEYIIATYEYLIYDYKVNYPYVMISNKSSKRKRGKSNDKRDAHFLRVDIKEPIKLVKKILSIYKKEFEHTDVVIFEVYSDSKNKREKLYLLALQSIGFDLVKTDKLGTILIHKGLKIKKKYINSVIEYFNQ